MPGKQNKIFQRIFFSFSILVVANTVLFALMVIPLQKESLKQTIYTQAETISRSIIQTSADALLSNDFSFLVEHAIEVLKNNTGIHYIFMESNRGWRIWVEQKQWRMLNETPQIFQHPQNTENMSSGNLRLVSYAQYEDVYHFSYPITFSTIHWGWIHIGFATERFHHNMQTMYYQISSIALILIIISFIVGFWFARWISRPISSISQLASQVAQGNLNVESNIQRQDEIGQLAYSFNTMIRALQTSKQKLENYNQTLAQQVTERTQELDKVNQNLDQRVREEVAARRQQEQLLIYQSRLAAMGEMIGAIAHQWRQPLNALGLVVQNIKLTHQHGKLDDIFLERSTEKANRLINNMSNTIDDFRNFFKPNKQAEKFHIHITLRNVAELLDASLTYNQIQLSIVCDESITIDGYQSELAQVLLNLINNAKDICLERAIERPQIYIQVKQNTEHNNQIEISVFDNGGGVPENIMDKIYNPYFTTKEEGKGTGIGLYMSKMIIENNMTGTLSNYNTLNGSCFVICLHQKTTKKSVSHRIE